VIIYTVLALLSSLLYSVSAVLCKYGLQHNVDVRSLSIRNLFLFLIKNKYWILGVILGGIANISIIQIQSQLDISIVYSILNVSYIFVLVLGHYFLRERLNRNQWLGVITAIVGTMMILAVRDTVTGSETDVNGLFSLTLFSAGVVVCLMAVSAKMKSMNYEMLYALCAGVCFGCVETYLKATTNLVASEIGYFSIFSLNSVIAFVSLWPFFVMFVYGAVGWVFLQITYSHGNVSITIPMIAVTQRIVSMSSGYYIFGEYFTFLKVLGIVTILLGVFILIFSTLKTDQKVMA